MVLKKYYEFDKAFGIFDEIDITTITLMSINLKLLVRLIQKNTPKLFENY